LISTPITFQVSIIDSLLATLSQGDRFIPCAIKRLDDAGPVADDSSLLCHTRPAHQQICSRDHEHGQERCRDHAANHRRRVRCMISEPVPNTMGSKPAMFTATVIAYLH
jgi:hypothetical protein